MRDLCITRVLSLCVLPFRGFLRWAESLSPLAAGFFLVFMTLLPPASEVSGTAEEAESGEPLGLSAQVEATPEDAVKAVEQAAPAPTGAPQIATVVPNVSAPKLSAEQSKVVSFISSQYRVAVDQSVQFVQLAYRAARDAKLDPHLVLAVMSIESRFDPTARSPRGAEGLMQVRTSVHAQRYQPFGGIAAAFDPVANIRVGTQILQELIQRSGSPAAGLKAYVGAGNSASDGGYGSKVLAAREQFAAIAAGRSPQLTAKLKSSMGAETPVTSSTPVTGDASHETNALLASARGLGRVELTQAPAPPATSQEDAAAGSAGSAGSAAATAVFPAAAAPAAVVTSGAASRTAAGFETARVAPADQGEHGSAGEVRVVADSRRTAR